MLESPMAVKEIVQAPNEILRAKAPSVQSIQDIQPLLCNLSDTMLAGGLIGIAAPQIGISQRVFLTELRATETRPGLVDQRRVFINPEITIVGPETNKIWEGCGSVENANAYSLVERAKTIKITATNEFGQRFELICDGLLARVVQHEFEHLEGGLFTDHPALNPEGQPIDLETYKTKYRNNSEDLAICQITTLQYRLLA